MKILRGKQKLNTEGKFTLVANWDKLWQFGGSLGSQWQFSRVAGRVLTIVANLGLVGSVLLVLSSLPRDLSDLIYAPRLSELLFWAALLIWAIGKYTLRPKAEFVVQEVINASKTKKSEVQMHQIIDLDAWMVLDKTYHRFGQNFIGVFGQEVIKHTDVRIVWQRLGLSPQQAEQLLVEVASLPPSLDQHLGLFEEAVRLALRFSASKLSINIFALAYTKRYLISGLLKLGVTKDEFEALLSWMEVAHTQEAYRQIWLEKAALKPTGTVNRAYTSRFAPTLEQFGQDYTRKAVNGNFAITIGKETAMRNLLRVLERSQASALIVGEPGVGKTQFLRHLAVRMVVEDVPKALQDQRLVSFDMPRAFTNSVSLENFKQVLQSMFDEVAESGDIVLVLDNLDQALDVRDDLKAEVVNTIVSALDAYKLRVIATSSVAGFNKHIKTQVALVNKLSVLELQPPSDLTAQQILIDAGEEIGRRYGVYFEVPAIRQLVRLAPKFDHDRVMPDKGVLLLEEAAMLASDQGLKTVSVSVIDKLVAEKVGIQVGRIGTDEAQVLLSLEKTLHERVVGQQAAISAVANALRRSRAGLNKSNKPIASFMFFGPTGVGKTEVAKTLAEVYYGSEKLMLRLDMSEYQESENIVRLLGAEKNGEFVGGYLTEAVRQRPFSLILLDEIEKANPKVLDLLLQILDEGKITDGLGRKIDFTNTIVIVTSNAGSKAIAELVQAGQTYNQVYQQVAPELRNIFRVELLNRFDQIIMFKTLSPIEIEQITANMLEELRDKLLDQGYHFKYTDTAVRELVQEGYNPIYGARQMRRVIQEAVENKIAEAIINGTLAPGGEFKYE